MGEPVIEPEEVRLLEELLRRQLAVSRRHARINASTLNGTHRSYRRTCRRLHLKPVPRERAKALIAEWREVLSGRPEPTTQYRRGSRADVPIRPGRFAGY